MMKGGTIDLRFKGTRTYLQGGDIYNSVQDLLSRSSSGYVCKLVFKTFAEHEIEVMMGEPTKEMRPIAHGLWRSSMSSVSGFWLRETDVPITESYEFDEDAITDNAVVRNKMIITETKNDHSIIENIIALTKKLSYDLAPAIDGQWVFAQITLRHRLPNEWSLIRLEQTNCLANLFSRNRIEVDGCDYGDIHFAVARP